MSSKVKRNEKRLRIYALLAEGKCKARVSELLGISEGTVHYHAGILEQENYLKRLKGSKNPILYEKGPKGTILDTAIHDLKVQINATGVTSPSKKTADVPTAKVHHGKVKLNVLKVGDLDELMVRENGNSFKRPFLSRYFNYRNVERWKGQVPYGEHFLSVEFERTPNMQTFYIHPPDLELTAEELPEYEKQWIQVSQGVANFLQKHAGWKFGIPELTDWDTHIAIEDPALMKGLSDKFYMATPNGDSWTSNSEGVAEWETKEIELAQIKLTLPHQVISLKTTISELSNNMAEIVKVLQEAEKAIESLTRINGVNIQERAEETLRRFKDDDDEDDPPDCMETKADPHDIEVMYQ